MYIKGIVRQFGYLLELYRDARSPEYKENGGQSPRRSGFDSRPVLWNT